MLITPSSSYFCVLLYKGKEINILILKYMMKDTKTEKDKRTVTR